MVKRGEFTDVKTESRIKEYPHASYHGLDVVSEIRIDLSVQAAQTNKINVSFRHAQSIAFRPCKQYN